MMNLPYATHRSLIEPLTEEKHLKKILISRFLTFMEMISNSEKQRVKMLMEVAKKDVRSITGSNYRNIMLLMGKCSVEDVKKVDIDKIDYFPLDENETWKVNCIKEILEARESILEIQGFNPDELEEMLNFLCTS